MNRSARARIQLGLVVFLATSLFVSAIVLGAEGGAAGESQKSDPQAKVEAPKKGSEHYTLAAVDIDGAKFWLPSTIVVRQGTEVELTLVNKLDAPHGFAIDGLKIKEEVPAKGSVTVHFTAKRSGTYPFYCQLHAPHIGGQILVQP